MKLKISTLVFLILSLSGFSQTTNALRAYSIGNASIKINASKDTLSNSEKLIWLENSALAFSDNEQELYFRHPTDNYFQVWNIANKQKTAEIPFSEAGNTSEGRRMISLFHNTAYPSDTYVNTKIWISEDLNVSFNKKNEFTIASLQNIPDRKFNISPRGYAFESNFMGYEKFVKKVPLTNIKYFFNYHKKSNKLFIIITGDQITKEKSYYPYFGIYTYNLTTDSKDSPTENIKGQATSGSTYKYRWYFSNNTIFNFYVSHPNMMYKEFGLDTVSKKDIKYSSISPADVYSDSEPNGWYMQYMGTDNAGNLYLCNPLNYGLFITKLTNREKNLWEPMVNIRHSTNRRNSVTRQKSETLNVMAVSGSGKLFAYLNLYNIPDSGNIASLMLYNDAEKDRIYTFNDQTKYQANIAKNYISDSESEDLALNWKKQTETSKQQRAALYKSQIDSLKIKIVESEKMLVANYQQDIDLAKQGKYAAMLIGKKWVGYKTYLSTMTYAGEDGGPQRTITAEFKIQEEFEFIKRGENIDAKMIETLTLPRGKENRYGELILKDKGLSDNAASQVGYGPVKYITSICSAPLNNFKWPEFALGNTPYIGCADPFGSIKGAEVIKESKYYKKFTDDYMNFLWKCNFKFYLSKGSLKLTLLAIGKDGTEINFDYETTSAQAEIINRKDNLSKQLRSIEELVEKGN